MGKYFVFVGVSLSDAEAAALAMLLRRAAFADYRPFSDCPEDTHLMMQATAKLLQTLHGAGYD